MRNTNKLSLFFNFIGVAFAWTVAVWLLISLATYNPSDPGLSWGSTSSNGIVINLGGRMGALVADVGLSGFGFSVFLVPIIVAIAGWNWLRLNLKNETVRIVAFIVFLLGSALSLLGASGLEHLYANYNATYPPGGIAGFEIAGLAVSQIGMQYATLLFVVIFTIGTASCRMIPWLAIFDLTGKPLVALGVSIFGGIGKAFKFPKKTKARMKSELAKGADSGEPRTRRRKVSSVKKPTPVPSQRKEPVIVPIDADEIKSRKTVSRKTRKSPPKARTVGDQPKVEASLVPPATWISGYFHAGPIGSGCFCLLQR